MEALFLRIGVKALSALSSQPAAVHHFSEQWMRAILRISCLSLQHLHDLQYDIESDQISERQRSHGAVSYTHLVYIISFMLPMPVA